VVLNKGRKLLAEPEVVHVLQEFDEGSGFLRRGRRHLIVGKDEKKAFFGELCDFESH
jgi:hypothetical protein